MCAAGVERTGAAADRSTRQAVQRSPLQHTPHSPRPACDRAGPAVGAAVVGRPQGRQPLAWRCPTFTARSTVLSLLATGAAASPQAQGIGLAGAAGANRQAALLKRAQWRRYSKQSLTLCRSSRGDWRGRWGGDPAAELALVHKACVLQVLLVLWHPTDCPATSASSEAVQRPRMVDLKGKTLYEALGVAKDATQVLGGAMAVIC